MKDSLAGLAEAWSFLEYVIAEAHDLYVFRLL